MSDRSILGAGRSKDDRILAKGDGACPNGGVADLAEAAAAKKRPPCRSFTEACGARGHTRRRPTANAANCAAVLAAQTKMR